jgi:hypothetical protein
MPERYEQEIEEILRNVERTRPKPSLGWHWSPKHETRDV